MSIKQKYSKEEWDKKYAGRKSIQGKLIAKAIEQEKPFMEDEDIILFEKELLKLGNNIDILEWGAGTSTRYYANLLNRKKIKFTWEAIEYDIRWYVEMLKMNLKNVRLHLFDQEVLRIDDRRVLRGYEMNEYVKFPTRLGKKYDLIFIDGTKRVRCLKESLNLLKKDGIVLVHDAQREEYKEGFNYYKGKHLSRMLWKGKSQ